MEREPLNYYEFKITGEILEDGIEDLVVGGVIDISAEFELKAKGDWNAIKEFTSENEEETFMRVEYWNEGELHVILSKTEEGEEGVRFLCNDSGLRAGQMRGEAGGERIMFTGKLIKQDNKTLVSAETEREAIKIVRGVCRVGQGDKTTATCDLKLSDTTGLKWSTKVSAKAKFEFSL